MASAASATTGRKVWLVPSKVALACQQLHQQRLQIHRLGRQRRQPRRARLTLELKRLRQQPV